MDGTTFWLLMSCCGLSASFAIAAVETEEAGIERVVVPAQGSVATDALRQSTVPYARRTATPQAPQVC